MHVLGRTGCLLTALLAADAAAALDLAPRAPAVRAGLGLSPDQFHGGIHVHLGRSRLRLRPSAEMGIGNGVLLAALGGDLLYHHGGGGWVPFVGGGPGLSFVDVTDGVGQAEGLEPRIVANAVAGIAWGRSRYVTELRVGFGDTPDLKLSIGLSF